MISVLSTVTEHTSSSPWEEVILSSSYWQQLPVTLSPNTDFLTLRWQWHPLCLSLCRCELTDPAATVWSWAGEAWGFSEDVLQGFRTRLHRVLDALGEAEAWTGTGVDWKDWSSRWWNLICSEVPEQGHSACRQILQHSLHGAQQPEIWRLCSLLLY